MHAVHQDKLNLTAKTRGNPLPWRGQFSPELVEALLSAYASRGEQVLDPFVGSGTVLAEAASKALPAVGFEVNPAAASLSMVYSLANTEHTKRRHTVEEVEARIADFTGRNGPLFDVLQDTVAVADIRRLFPEMSSGGRILLRALITMAEMVGDGLCTESVRSVWKRLRALVAALPFTDSAVRVMLRDARATGLPDACIDLAVTSPPYINVFNYHQQYRAATEALGWDVLLAARSEIGANRKHRQNRFLTVIQYGLDMTAVLLELRRVIRGSGQVILVVGRESKVRKTPFKNGALLSSIATGCGYEIPLAQERVFMNRFGHDIIEDIIHLRPAEMVQASDALRLARDTVHAALVSAVNNAPDESKSDLITAIDAADSVVPSPVLPETTWPD